MISLLLVLCSTMGFASFSLPQNLNAHERSQVVDVIGLGTTSKFLSNAYPLGGYDGLEVSVSAETFDVRSINQLGATTTSSDSVYYPQITIGKGLFYNSDIFINFVPFNDTSKISRYGLQYRMSLYQADFFPLNFSFLLQANSANISNQMISRNLSSDILLGTMLDDLSFTISVGYVTSTGDFTGGSQGVTDSLRAERSSATSLHVGMGIVYTWNGLLIGVAIDRYKDAVFNAKVGLLL